MSTIVADEIHSGPAVEERAKLISWYRSPIEIEEMRKLYVRSDIRAWRKPAVTLD